MVFIHLLCEELNMDKKDMLGFFNTLKNKNIEEEETVCLFEGYEISKLDINRIYRYIDHLTVLEDDTVKFKDEYENIIINENQYI
jgi:tetraacyldisaccharide-1-P 4'-kinase